MNILPMAAGWAMLVVVLEVFTFSFLLANDIISRSVQILFFGPLLGGLSLLHHMRYAWGVPIPSTEFGGLPDWVYGLLLLVNWLFYTLLGVFYLVWRERRTRLQG